MRQPDGGEKRDPLCHSVSQFLSLLVRAHVFVCIEVENWAFDVTRINKY